MDYKEPALAPLTFDIIDTSNLTDHIGTLNVLSATSLLLTQTPCVTLYTEVLVRKTGDNLTIMDQLLSGHCPTIALLLGLIPPGYWMNATTIPDHESIMNMMLRPSELDRGQLRPRLAWKNAVPVLAANLATPKIHLPENDLAQVDHHVYRGMFEYQNLTQLFFDMGMTATRKALHQQYQRGSLAWFLRSVKRTIDVDRDAFISNLLGLIEEDSEITMIRNYIQELYVQLYLLRTYSISKFRQRSYNNPNWGDDRRFMHGWKNVPPVVCVTLEIPRKNLKVFTDLARTATPTVHCILQSLTSQW